MSPTQAPLALLRALIPVLLLLIISPAITNDVDALVLEPNTVVHITNKLDSHAYLPLRCYSKGADLNPQNISFSETYTFPIWSLAKFGSLRYYCRFIIYDKAYMFDIYVQSRDKNMCRDCPWEVKESGPCLLRESIGSLCYAWNSR